MQERQRYAKSEAMPTEAEQPQPPAPNAGECAGPLTPEAERALAEAAARRAQARATVPAETEINGRGGPDPARYGDWEINGLASDF